MLEPSSSSIHLPYFLLKLLYRAGIGRHMRQWELPEMVEEGGARFSGLT
jgi:hypothetical protein